VRHERPSGGSADAAAGETLAGARCAALAARHLPGIERLFDDRTTFAGITYTSASR
jgi:hypothetical protein